MLVSPDTFLYLEGLAVKHWKTMGMTLIMKTMGMTLIMVCYLLVTAAAGYEQRAMKATNARFAKLVDNGHEHDVEIIRDNFRFVVVIVGAIMGATLGLVFVVLRGMMQQGETFILDTHAKRGMYWIMSAFFSTMLTPSVVRTSASYMPGLVNPEILLAAAGIMAIIAWVAMQIIDYCTKRFSGAAKEKGLAGLREEAGRQLGGNQK